MSLGKYRCPVVRSLFSHWNVLRGCRRCSLPPTRPYHFLTPLVHPRILSLQGDRWWDHKAYPFGWCRQSQSRSMLYATSAHSISGLAGPWVCSAGYGHRSNVCEHLKNSGLVHSMLCTHKKTAEVIETVSRRKIDLCCLQETWWRGGPLKSRNGIFTGKNTRYNVFWVSNKEGNGGVGTLWDERCVSNMFGVVPIREPGHPSEIAN